MTYFILIVLLALTYSLKINLKRMGCGWLFWPGLVVAVCLGFVIGALKAIF